MANVNGNYKGGKFLKKIPGQGVRTHDVMKGICFKDKAFRLGSKAKMAGQRRFGKIAKSYAKYGKPTETLFRRTGAAALGTGKFLVKRGLFGFPGLAATGLYLGAKGIAKRQKGLSFSSFRQFNKKGRKVL